MFIPRFVVVIFSVGVMVLGAGGVCGQDYPNKSIRIFTSPVGGGGDFASRLIAQGISAPLGQPVIVENRGGGIAPGEAASKALPDGYTLLVQGASFWLAPLTQKTPYDPVKDFAPITLVSRQPNLLVVHPSLPVKSVKELIALAKTRPGELNYASGSGAGSSSTLSGELFKSMAGVNITRISYKGSALSINDLLSGEVQITFEIASVVEQHVKSGRLRALAVTTAEPSPLAPGLPTVAGSGLPGFEMAQMSGIFAPAKTPEAIVNRLNQEIVRFLNTTDAKERFFTSGVEAVGSSPEQLAATMKAEIAKTAKVIKDAGLKGS